MMRCHSSHGEFLDDACSDVVNWFQGIRTVITNSQKMQHVNSSDGDVVRHDVVRISLVDSLDPHALVISQAYANSCRIAFTSA